MSAPRTHRPRARAGFSLLELMVALTVGGLAITSIYAVGSASTRVFYQQQQVANTAANTANTAAHAAISRLRRASSMAVLAASTIHSPRNSHSG